MHQQLLRNFKRRLRFHLDRRGWSKQRLSLKAGLTRTAVFHMLEKDHLPQVANLYAISRVLGESIDQLLSPVEDPEDLEMEARLRKAKGF